jgi:para-nitrobenzyl esterase
MDVIVETKHGRVRGVATGGVCGFLGIAYAAPPVGTNRLRPPRPVESWTGVRDASVIGPEPPQPQFAGNDPSGMLFDPAVPGDDCLNLNIWTPDPGAVGLPVMVWSPGGAFRFSSGGGYDGSRFARDGVVCVTINWRTGADGFLYLGEGDDGANLGLLDQVAALTWVQENITAFGSDPARVTVFGESAGAMSIGVLLSMPRAEGLFRRAVLQSGAAHHVIPAAEAARIGTRARRVARRGAHSRSARAGSGRSSARGPGADRRRGAVLSRSRALGQAGRRQHHAVPPGRRR